MFKKGDIVVYQNSGIQELGIVLRENNANTGYFIFYSVGDTAANTISEDLTLVEDLNEYKQAINFSSIEEMIQRHSKL